jgi:hypothetical protein
MPIKGWLKVQEGVWYWSTAFGTYMIIKRGRNYSSLYVQTGNTSGVGETQTTLGHCKRDCASHYLDEVIKDSDARDERFQKSKLDYEEMFEGAYK